MAQNITVFDPTSIAKAIKGLPGNSKKHPMMVAAAVDIINKAGSPIPVAVRRALPALNAKAFAVQDLTKYLMQPGRIFDKQPWQTGAVAGQGMTSYTFFARAVGQAGVTNEDTNMKQASNIGQNNAFVITSVGIDFLSSISPTTTGTDAVITTTNQIADFNAVMRRGVAQLTVNSVPQFLNGIGPLKALMPQQQIIARGGIATGNAAGDIMAMPEITGSKFEFNETPITLVGGAPFSFTVEFPNGAITLPSANTLIGQNSFLCTYLDGYWLRPAG